MYICMCMNCLSSIWYLKKKMVSSYGDESAAIFGNTYQIYLGKTLSGTCIIVTLRALLHLRGSSYGIVANVLDCYIIVSEFEL